ncbi:MAG: hypothetical protein IJO79_05510 [Firmicutes bacterium]|nr:hypothetical protein [Bacillota bacterium]
MNLNSRKGFSSVFLTAILLSFVLITGTFAEASAGYAARSTADGILRLAAQSVLAEYDRALFQEYGLFGVSLHEELLESRIRQYGEAGFAKSAGAADLLRLELQSVKGNLSEGSLLSPEVVSFQIQEYMEGRILTDPQSWEALAGLLGQISTLNHLIGVSDSLADDFQAAKLLLEETSSSEDGDLAYAEENYAQAQGHALGAVNMLQSQINGFSSGDPELLEGSLLPEPSGFRPEESLEDEMIRVLANEDYMSILPSRLLEVDKGMAFSLSGSPAQNAAADLKENFLLSTYIVRYFDSHLSREGEGKHYFQNEGEYVLFGQMSDDANYQRTKASLITLRTALNLIHIYTDEVKYQETLALAASILPGPAAPILQFVIALAWAGAEAGKDMERLEDGKNVPLFKTRESWILSLAGTVENASAAEDEGRGLHYENYLFLFLLLTDREAKLVRIMDLIQINLQASHDSGFAMKDSYCSVAFTAEVVRRSGFFGKRGQRFGTFAITQGYDE